MIQSALSLIESVASDRVLFCGESIIDVYEYVSPLGKASKDLVLSVESVKKESFEGGIQAAVNHASSFVGMIDVWSDRSITKRRFVEGSYFRKVGIQVYDPPELNHAAIPSELASYHAVCVIDYGHGMMAQQYSERLEDEAAYLAVNVQTNSGNYGYNLATKYERCDYLVVDESEARLATQNQSGDIEKSLAELSYLSPKVIITLGRKGAIGWSTTDGVKTCASFTESVVDTIGAGDAFFAVTAPMSRTGSIQDLMLIGNAAGGLKAQTLGHSKPVTKKALIERLKSL